MINIKRIFVITLFILSIIIGMIPSLANRYMYQFLFLILVVINCFYIFAKIKDKQFVITVNDFLLFISFVVLSLVRTENNYLYAFMIFNIIFAYKTLFFKENDNFLIFISKLVTFSIIPTLIFNGMFNHNLTSGIAFSGRLNPFMYFPYIMICINYNLEHKRTNIFNYFMLLLVVIDLFWSESRICILSIVIFFILCIVYLKKKTISSKKLLLLLLVFILINIFVPSIYISLYNNFYNELNNFSLNYTGKSFFSGRQRIWISIFEKLKDCFLFGTGDINFNFLVQPPHNEFMNLYYCWGIITSSFTYYYLYKEIGKKIIQVIVDKKDLIIYFSFLVTILCTTFETYSYAIHFFIFETFLISYLYNKIENKANKKEKF